MKRHQIMLGQLALVCVFAAAHASAANSESHTQPATASLAGNAANLHTTGFASQSAVKPGKLRHKQLEQANLAGFGGGVVQEMRATSALVEERAAKAATSDSWLVVLAALGLVVLQLRRKHNSLPQRRIAPYA
jgi:hypothetical protein